MTRPPNQGPLTETEMLTVLERGIILPPLVLRLQEGERQGTPDAGPEALIEAVWESETAQFVVEFKARSTPKVFDAAVRQARQFAERSSHYPMIVLPYLRPEQLEQLEQMQVSGLDLSGNGIVIVPGRLLVYRTGKRNKYPESLPTKYAYRGATSLVGRVFLCRTSFESLADIEQEIQKRGGRIALSTISKALRRMEEDVIVEKGADKIRLLQPDTLLDKLAASYRPPIARRRIRCSAECPLTDLLAQPIPLARLVLSGGSSVNAYAVMGREECPIAYCDNIYRILDAWGDRVRETSRFADLKLQETNDATVFFDRRTIRGMPYASPVQAYLECTAGDKREKEAAEQVRDGILRELQD